MRIPLVLAVLVAAACATPYGPGLRNALGGFSDTQLDRNVWTVSFNGNGFTSPARVADFILLRSAELVLDAGFQYFVIAESSDTSSVHSYTAPVRSESTSTVRGYGRYARVETETVSSGGGTTYYAKPGRMQTVVGFMERPDVPAMVYDADFLVQSLRTKYKIHPKSQPAQESRR